MKPIHYILTGILTLALLGGVLGVADASTITLINATDTISGSRNTINNNFLNLNNDKVQLGGDLGGTTTTPRLSLSGQSTGTCAYFTGSLWIATSSCGSGGGGVNNATGTPGGIALFIGINSVSSSALLTFNTSTGFLSLSTTSFSGPVNASSTLTVQSLFTAISNAVFNALTSFSQVNVSSTAVFKSSITQSGASNTLATTSISGLLSASNINSTGSITINGQAVGTSTGANPSASIGLTPVNGSANTFLRSDSAPAISTSIAPIWTALHQFSGSGVSTTQLRSASNTLSGTVYLPNIVCSAGQVLTNFATGTRCVADQTGGGGGINNATGTPGGVAVFNGTNSVTSSVFLTLNTSTGLLEFSSASGTSLTLTGDVTADNITLGGNLSAPTGNIDGGSISAGGGTGISNFYGAGLVESGGGALDVSVSAPITISGDSITLTTTTVVSSSYTCTNLSVDDYGRITSATNGTCTGGGGVSATGTPNYFPYYTGTSTLSDTSTIQRNGNQILLGGGSAVTALGTVEINNSGSASRNVLVISGSGNSATDAAGIVSYTSGGTAAARTTTTIDTSLFFFGGRGYSDGAFNSGSRGAINIKSQADFTSSSQPTYIVFETIANGSTTRRERMRVTGEGLLGIGTTQPSTTLHVNGSSTFTASTTFTAYPNCTFKTNGAGLLECGTDNTGGGGGATTTITATGAAEGPAFTFATSGLIQITGSGATVTFINLVTSTASLPNNAGYITTTTIAGRNITELLNNAGFTTYASSGPWTASTFLIQNALNVSGTLSANAGLTGSSSQAWGGNLNVTGTLSVRGNGVSTSTGANPTASIGLSAVNGTANTFLRSDAAPAIDQGITPNWTALHQFTGAGVSSTQLRSPSGTISNLFISNATASGNITANTGNITGLIFTSATSSGNLQIATLRLTGAGNVSSTLTAQGATEFRASTTLPTYQNCALETNGSGLIVCGTDDTGGGGGLQLPSITVAASGGNFTSLEDAVQACNSTSSYPNGCSIQVASGTYTVATTSIIMKNRMVIEGQGGGTRLNWAAQGTSTALFRSDRAINNVHIRNFLLNQSSATYAGDAFDWSNIAAGSIQNIRSVAFLRFFTANDTTFTGYYNKFENITSFDDNCVVVSSTNLYNANVFSNFNCHPNQSGNGTAANPRYGFFLSNGQANTTYDFRVEPATVTGSIAYWIQGANSANNNNYNVYFENNATNTVINSGVQRTGFFGGWLVNARNANIVNSGIQTLWMNVASGTNSINQIPLTDFTSFISNSPAGKTLSITNDTVYAHNSGSLVNMRLLNGTDTSTVLKVDNAGVGFNLLVNDGSNNPKFSVSNNTTSVSTTLAINGSTTLSKYLGCTLKTNGAGLLECGTDNTGGGGGDESGWRGDQTGYVRLATSTDNVGIGATSSAKLTILAMGSQGTTTAFRITNLSSTNADNGVFKIMDNGLLVSPHAKGCIGCDETNTRRVQWLWMLPNHTAGTGISQQFIQGAVGGWLANADSLQPALGPLAYLGTTNTTTPATASATVQTGANSTRLMWSPDFKIFWQATGTLAHATGSALWFGLSQSIIPTSTVTSTQFVGFRRDGRIDTNWMAIANNGSATSTFEFNTGVPYATGTPYEFRVKASTSTGYQWFINGIQVASTTNYQITSSTGLVAFGRLQNLVSSTPRWYFSKILLYAQ